MFDIGWTEVVVIVIVACVLLDVKDIPKILKWIHKLMNYFSNFVREFKQIFNEITDEPKLTKLLDEEGKEHLAYDLDEIMPDIIEDNGRSKRKKN